jgi:hypothetical protein
VYGPRVRALHTEAGEESKALFDEFEKMLGAVDQRLDEGVRELETLVQQTGDQLRLLIGELNDDGAVRFVIERPDEVEAVFGLPLDALLEEMYGIRREGFRERGRAYLSSGCVPSGARLLRARLEQTEADPAIERLLAYAEGMHDYISRDYASSVRHLAVWADSGVPEPPLVALARDAVSSVVQLADGDDRTQIASEADRAARPARRPGARDPQAARRRAGRGSGRERRRARAEVEPGRASAHDQREPDDLRLGEPGEHARVHAQRLDREAAEPVRDQILAEQERALVAALPEHERHGQEPEDLVDLGGMDRTPGSVGGAPSGNATAQGRSVALP